MIHGKKITILIFLMAKHIICSQTIFNLIDRDYIEQLEQHIEDHPSGEWKYYEDEESGDLPLNYAIKENKTAAAMLMIKKGADLLRGHRSQKRSPNIRSKYFSYTPLFTAITNKNLYVAKAILSQYSFKMSSHKKYLAQVVEYAYLTLFEQELDLNKNFEYNNYSQEIAKLLQSVVDERFYEEHLSQLSKVLSLFADEVDIALAISFLKSSLKDKQKLSSIMNRCADFFLSEKLSPTKIADLVTIFHHSNEYNAAILLIIKAYEKNHETDKIPKTSKKKKRKSATIIRSASMALFNIDKDSEPDKAQILANTIYRVDKDFITKFNHKQIIRNYLHKKDQGLIYQHLCDWFNNLSQFVQASILWPSGKSLRIINYDFWLEVAQKLIKLGDLNGVMIISTALDGPNVANSITIDKHPKLISICDPNNNFSTYYALKKSLAKNIDIIPALNIFFHELALSFESTGLTDKPLSKSLNFNTVEYFLKHKKEHENLFNSTNQKKVKIDDKIYFYLKNLPNNIEAITLALKEIVRFNDTDNIAIDQKPMPEWDEKILANLVRYLEAPKNVLNTLVKHFHIYNGKELYFNQRTIEDQILQSLKNNAVTKKHISDLVDLTQYLGKFDEIKKKNYFDEQYASEEYNFKQRERTIELIKAIIALVMPSKNYSKINHRR